MTFHAPLPSGYFSSPGRCPSCSRVLAEIDRLDDQAIWACGDRCGQEDVDELRGMIVDGPAIDAVDVVDDLPPKEEP
jgi:hypothetical protein